MNTKPISIASVVLAVTAAAMPLYAQNNQNAGFRMGLAQPQNALGTPATGNPIQGMTSSPIQGMTQSPILPLGGGISTPQTAGTPQSLNGLGDAAVAGITILPPGGTVFVPAGTLVVENGAGLQTGAFLSAPVAPVTTNVSGTQSPSRGGSTSNQRSNRGGNPAPQTPQKQDATRLELGTPRDKVIEKYGNPIAFMMGMNGETLYFNGGVVVFVKNGVVATPGN